MDLGIAGRTALITASSKGIGKACAMELASQGTNIVMCARGRAQLEQAAEEVRAVARGEVTAIPADLTSAKDIDALIDAAENATAASTSSFPSAARPSAAASTPSPSRTCAMPSRCRSSPPSDC